MIAWTIYITVAGAVLVLLFPRAFSRWIALLTTTATFAISLATFFCHDLDLAHFTTIVRVPWVPALGMNYHLAVDGISLTLVLVTSITAVSSVLFSWDVDERPNEFFFWLLLVVGGSFGVFLSADLFLLFVFYELVIVPKYFLIAIWGSTNKEYGAMKLTLYSFFGGALVFIGIIAAYVSAGSLDLNELAPIPIYPAITIVGLPGFVPRFCRSCRHLAIAHLGADRPRRRADRGFDVARRNCDETRSLRRAARRDESFPARFPNVEKLDRGSGRDRNCLCRSGGPATARPEIRHRLFKREPHGFRASWAWPPQTFSAFPARCCKCFPTA